MIRNSFCSLSILLSCTCFASSEIKYLPKEIWIRSPGEIIYARADQDSHRLTELCIELPEMSFLLPPEALPESGMVDLHSLHVSRSAGVYFDEKGNIVNRSLYLSVHFEHESLPGKNSDARLQSSVIVHFTDGRPDSTAEVSEELVGGIYENEDLRSREVAIAFQKSRKCPTPKSSEWPG